MREFVLFALLMTLTVITRTLFLYDIPYRVDGDAARFALDGIRYLIAQPAFFATGWEAHTNAYIYLVGHTLQLFENDVIGIRALSALGGVLGVAATYLMARELFGSKIALWAGFFLSISPFHLVFSRNGMEVVWVTFFAPLSMFFLFKNKHRYAILAGILAGIAQYFTPISRFIPIMATLYLFLAIFMKGVGLRRAVTLGLGWLTGLLLVYAPMLWYYIHNQHTYWARVERVSIFSSEWFDDQVKKKGLYGAYMSQFANSFLAFHLPVYTEYPSWYFRTPFLDKIPMVLFTGGLAAGLVKFGTWQAQWLFLYLLVGIVFGGVLTAHSPIASRYTILFPAVACFMGIGMSLVQAYLREVNRKYIAIIIAVVVILLARLQLHSYYLHETVDTWNHDRNSHIATYAGRYLSTVDEDYDVYFVGTNYIFYQSVKSLPFLTGKDGIDIYGPVDDTINHLNHTQKNFFIIVPSREDELAKLQAAFPNHKTREFYNPLGTFLFWLVEV